MREVLRNRNFMPVWLAGLVSVAGDFAFTIALPIHIYTLTDSTLATAGAFAVSVVPRIVLGSVAGVFVDRWDRKRTMIVADVSRAALLGLLLLPGPADRLWVIYPIAAALGGVGQFFGPAEDALVPRIVPKEQLVAANALNSLNDELGRLIGPAIGAGVYALTNLGGVALIDALSYAASAICIAAVTADARPLVVKARESGVSLLRHTGEQWREGLAIVHRHQGLTALFIATAFAGLSEGFFITLALAPLILNVLGGTDAQVGWIMSAQAVGGIIAGVVVARAATRFSPRWLMIAGMIGLGCSDLGFFNANRFAGPGTPAVLIAMGFMVLSGFPATANGIGLTTLQQIWTDDSHRGRVSGARRAFFGLANLIGLGIAGVTGDAIGIVPMLIFGSFCWIAGGVVAWALFPPPESEPRAAPEPA